MKTSVLILLSGLLTMAILAPSAITLFTQGDKTALLVDFNDEEQKEEKKEATEKDFFVMQHFMRASELQKEKITISSFYIESDYHTSLAIFLPPPENS